MNKEKWFKLQVKRAPRCDAIVPLEFHEFDEDYFI